MLQNKVKINIIKNYLIGLLAFTMPLNKYIQPAIIVIIMILALLEQIIVRNTQVYKNKFFLASISFYLIHIFGLIYSNNIKAASFDIEQKLVLLIFPFVFFSSGKIEEDLLKKVLKSFVLGNIGAVIICFLYASSRFYLFEDQDYFYYNQFSAMMHPSYFSLYLNFCIIILLFFKDLKINSLVKYTGISIFTIAIVLNASKSGLISLLLIILIFLITTIKAQKQLVKIITIVITTIGITASVFIFSPKTVIRFKEMVYSLNSSDNNLNSTGIRVLMWKNSIEIIKNNLFFGVGTGDVKDALEIQCNKNSESLLANKKLNAHNQFLQTTISLGIIGLIALIYILGMCFYTSWLTKQTEALILVAIITVNLIFESMLETQSGVIFISFFVFLYSKIAIDRLNLNRIL